MDTYASHSSGLSAPGANAAAVVPNDGQDLANVGRGLWVGGGGNIAVVMSGDATNTPVLFSGIPAGTLLPIRAKRIMSTNTTATLMVVIW